MSNDINYFANSFDSNTDKTISFTVVASKDISEKDLKALVSHIITNEESAEVNEVTISKKGNDFTYKIGEKEETITLGTANATWKVMLLKKPEESKSKTLSWSALHQKLVSSWPVDVPLLGFVTKYALSPIITTWRFLSQPSEKERSASRLNKLIDSFEPSNPKEFRHLLKRRLDLFYRANIHDETTVQLHQAVTISKDIEEGKETPATLTSKLNEAIQNRQEGPVLNLATGYYSNEGVFTPILSTFSIESDNTLILRQTRFARDEDDQTQPEKIYTFDLTKENNFGRLFTELLEKQRDPATLGTPAYSKKQKKLLNTLLIAQKDESTPIGSPSTLSQHIEMDKLMKDCGCTSIETNKKSVADGWELLFEHTSKSTTKEELTSEKIQYSFALVNEELSLLEKGLEELPPDERKKCLEELGSRVKELEKRVNRYFVNEKAFSHILREGGCFKEFSERLQAMQEKCKMDLIQQKQKTDQALTEGIIVKPNKPLPAVPVAEMKPVSDIVKLEQTPRAVEANFEKLQSLENAFNSNNVEASLKLFQELNSVVDSYVAEKRFTDAIELSNAILNKLPIPATSNSNPNNFWHNLNWEQLDNWGKAIDDVTKYQWESSLHLHQQYMHPEQLINQMNARAVLVRIARAKSQLAKAKVHEKFPNIANEDIYQVVSNFALHQNYNMIRLNLTYEEAAAILFDGYQTDFKQFTDLLQLHPYYRLAGDPFLENKALQIQNYLTSVAPDGGNAIKDPKIMRLDANIDVPEGMTPHMTYHYRSDFDYRCALNTIYSMYQKELDFNKNLPAFYCPQNTKKSLKPAEITTLQRHTTMIQSMLNPDYSIGVAFSSAGLGALAVVNFLTNIEAEAEKLAKIPSERKEIMTQMATQMMKKDLDSMGRLELDVDSYVIEKEPVISIVDKNTPSKKLHYFPWGRGLPEQVKSKFEFQEDYKAANPLAGDIPSEWIDSTMGVRDRENLASPNVPLIEDRTIYTEKGHLDRCIHDIEGNVVNEWLLRTLEVRADDPGSDNKYLNSSLIEAFDLMRAKPELLDDERVQRRLEMIITRPYLLQTLLRSNPAYIESFAKDLQKLIYTKISLKREQSALFLMHIGEMLYLHADAASKSLGPLDPYKTLSPYDNHEIVPLQAQLKRIANSMPRYDTKYGEAQIPGLTTIKTWEKDATKDQISIQLALLDHFISSHPNITLDTIKTIPTEDLARLIETAPLLQYACHIRGLPVHNLKMIEILEHQIYPLILKAVQEDSKLKNALLNELLIKKGETPPEPEWIDSMKRGGEWTVSKNDPSCFINGAYSIQLRTNTVTLNNKIIRQDSSKAEIPPSIRNESTLYQKFFDHESIIANLSAGDKPGEWNFEFKKGKNNYRISYDFHTKSLVLAQKIKTGENSSEWFRFFQPHQEQQTSGTTYLIQENGLWMSSTNPKNAVCIIPTNDTSKSNLILKANLDDKGRVSKLTSPDGRIVCHPEEKESFITATHPNQILYLRKPQDSEVSEIRFLDVGLHLIKNEKGIWECQDRLKGAQWLPQDQAKLQVSNSCSKSVQAIQATLEETLQQNSILLTKGKEQTLLIWPHQLAQNEAGDTTLEHDPSLIAKPGIVLTINEEGKVATSAAGCLYLSYLYANQGDYKLAVNYLEKAKASRLESADDLHAFTLVSNYLRMLTPNGKRGLAFQIKAESALVSIEKQQLGRYQYDPDKWGPYFGQVQRFCDLYEAFEKRGGSKDIESYLTLNAQEVEELNTLNKEGMRFYLDVFKASHIKKESPVPELAIQALKPDDLKTDFIATLVAMANKSKNKLSDAELLNPQPLTSEFILRNFITYYNKICKNEFHLEQLKFLLRPLEDQSSMSLNPQELQLVAMADQARRLLIQSAYILKDSPRRNDLCIEKESVLAFDELNLLPNPETGKVKKAYEYLGLVLNGLKVTYQERSLDNLEANIQDAIYPSEKATQLLDNFKRPLELMLGEANKKEKYISLAGVALAKPKAKKETKGKYLIDQEALKKGFENAKTEGILTDLEISMIESAIDKEISETTELELLLKVLQSESKISFVDHRREKELKNRINILEQKLVNELDNPPSYAPLDTTTTDVKFDFYSDAYFIEPTKERTEKLESLSLQLQNIFNEDIENIPAMEKQENAEIRAGINLAKENLIQQVQNSRSLEPERVEPLKKYLEIEIQIRSRERDSARQEIINWAKNSRDPKLVAMIKDPSFYSDQDIVDYVLDCYQMQQLQGSEKAAVNQIGDTITRFLILATAVQQMESALSIAKSLDPSKTIEWNENSALIYQTLTRGLDTNRYTEKAERFSRKYLVAEYRTGRILRPGQILYIEAFNKNPTLWGSLRPGLGKTSYIMPIVANLLVENGFLPILLAPSALQDMNLADFDRTTRTLYGQGAEPWKFPSETIPSAGWLANIYYELLQTRSEREYFVTTVDTLANIKNSAVMLAAQRSKLVEKINESGKSPSVEQKMALTEIEKKLYWLNKIELLLDGKNKAVSPSFFGDEVDSILSISKEINKASSDKVPVNTIARTTIKSTFDVILNNPELEKFKNVLLQGIQAGSTQEIKSHLPEVAKALLKNPDFRAAIQAGQKDQILDSINEKEMIEFLCGQRDELPTGLPAWDPDAKTNDPNKYQQQCTIAAAKRFISLTLPSISQQDPGDRFGFSNSVEGLIVPKDKKDEPPGTRFGDEYELIGYQYLGYLQAFKCQSTSSKDPKNPDALLTSTEFFVKAVATLQEQQPELYQELVQDAEKLANRSPLSRIEIAQELIQQPSLYNHRLKILEDIVWPGGYISRYKEQIALSVQSVVNGRNVGGVTGTLNPYALPNYDPKAKSEGSSREVEAETFLQMGVNHPAGFDLKVGSFNETSIMDYFNVLLHQHDCKAIINEGGYGMEGLTTLEWARSLQKLENGKDRSFLIIIPNAEGQRKIHLLKPGKEPIEFSGKTLPPKCVCLFAPQDTRGTDVPIPPGRTHYFPSRMANLQEMGQSIWRGRGTGGRHTPEWHVPETMLKTFGDNKDTLGDGIDALKKKGVDQQGGLNLKAQLFRISDTATRGIRQCLFAPIKEMDNDAYWNENNDTIIMANTVAQDTLFSVFRSYFVKDKSINFESDYQPSKLVQTENRIEQAYTDEIDQLKSKETEIIDAAAKLLTKAKSDFITEMGEEKSKELLTKFFTYYHAQAEPKNIQNALDQLFEGLKDDFLTQAIDELPDEVKESSHHFKEDLKAMILNTDKSMETQMKDHLKANTTNVVYASSIATGLGYTAMSTIDNMASLFGWTPFKAEEQAQQSIEEQFTEERIEGLDQIREGYNQISESRNALNNEDSKMLLHVLTQFGNAVSSLKSVSQQLETEKKEFIEHKETHKKFVPEQVVQSAAGVGGSQEQVQEQQMQQQQTQATVKAESGDKDDSLDLQNQFANWNSHQDAHRPNFSPNTMKPIDGILPNCGLNGIFLTVEMQKIFDRLPSLNGNPIGRICVNNNGDVELISKLDYHNVIGPMCDRFRKLPRYDVRRFDVFLPTRDGINFVASARNEQPNINDPRITLRIAQLKFILGYQPTITEIPIVTNWIKGLKPEEKQNLQTWLQNKGNPNSAFVKSLI